MLDNQRRNSGMYIESVVLLSYSGYSFKKWKSQIHAIFFHCPFVSFNRFTQIPFILYQYHHIICITNFRDYSFLHPPVIYFVPLTLRMKGHWRYKRAKEKRKLAKLVKRKTFTYKEENPKLQKWDFFEISKEKRLWTASEINSSEKN